MQGYSYKDQEEPIRPCKEGQASLRSRCTSEVWPIRSSDACWNCCYGFDSIPVFLPMSRDAQHGTFHMFGNFCSWNCAKAYRFREAGYCQKAISTYLSLFAFLTSYRPRYCAYPITERHPFNCPCLENYIGISLAPRKELLQMFGGNMKINEYRSGFLSVDKIEWINACFKSRTNCHSRQHITTYPRSFVYDFYRARIEESEQKDEQESEPQLLMDNIDESFFF